MNILQISVFLCVSIATVGGDEIEIHPPIGEPMDEEAKLIDTKNSSVWGPGLMPHVLVLPARYFYVKLIPVGNAK